MKRWIVATLCAVASLAAQTVASVTGRITGEGVGPIRGEVTLVTGGSTVQIRDVITDDQGVFRIDLPSGQVLLVARAEGYVSEERQLIVRPGPESRTVQFSLAPAGSLSGRVFDESGAGVPRARVWLTYAGETRAWRAADEAGGEAADAFGYFTIPVVAQGRPFRLHAESEGHLPSSSGTLVLRAREMPGVVLMLNRLGTTVRGRVVDATGNPVASADIHLRVLPVESEFTAEQRASFTFARSTNRTTTSSGDGSYSFPAVPAGRVVVTAASGARRTLGEGTTVAGRDTEILLTLR